MFNGLNVHILNHRSPIARVWRTRRTENPIMYIPVCILDCLFYRVYGGDISVHDSGNTLHVLGQVHAAVQIGVGLQKRCHLLVCQRDAALLGGGTELGLGDLSVAVPVERGDDLGGRRSARQTERRCPASAAAPSRSGTRPRCRRPRPRRSSQSCRRRSPCRR